MPSLHQEVMFGYKWVKEVRLWFSIGIQSAKLTPGNKWLGINGSEKSEILFPIDLWIVLRLDMGEC